MSPPTPPTPPPCLEIRNDGETEASKQATEEWRAKHVDPKYTIRGHQPVHTGMCEGGTGCITTIHKDPLGSLPDRMEIRMGYMLRYIWESVSARLNGNIASNVIVDLKRSAKKRMQVINRDGVQIFVTVNKFDEWQKRKDSANEFVNLNHFMHNILSK